MKQADFFDIEGRLARLSGLGDQFEAFPGLSVLKSSALIGFVAEIACSWIHGMNPGW